MANIYFKFAGFLMTVAESATNVSFGASPKIFPRPDYPSIVEVAKSWFRDIVIQAGA